VTARVARTQGYRYVGQPGRVPSRYIFTCEHASNTVNHHPVTPSDQTLLSQHWGWDIGAAALVEVLCEKTCAIGVLGTESRLVIDVNRHPDSDTLIVPSCEGIPVSFNQNITPEDLELRLDIFNDFHGGLRSAIQRQSGLGVHRLVSIHSFTPVWQGVPRDIEVGVLFDRYTAEAQRIAQALQTQGVKAGLNVPYSGMIGELMYSATMHGDEHHLPYLEFEIRQDLLTTEQDIEKMAQCLVTALEVF
jgi:predicted N-formylglutamate amidohydrolase